MNNGDVKNIVRKPMVVGFAMLVLGLLIGASAEQFLGRSSNGKSRSSLDGKMQRQTPDTLLPGVVDSWDPFREMRDLQAEMNEMFRRSVARFHSSPLMNPFKNDTGYSLSLDVRDLKDRFEVRAFLPDAKVSDAKVKLEGNRLEVEVTHRQTDNQQGKHALGTTTNWGRYTQVVELTGNLKSDQMKVEHKDHELLITIPKA